MTTPRRLDPGLAKAFRERLGDFMDMGDCRNVDIRVEDTPDNPERTPRP